MKNRLNSISLLLAACMLCRTARANVAKSDFGKLPDGTAVQRWNITNSGGASVSVMTYGATVVSLNMPDRAGKMDDVVLGYEQLDGYLANSPYFGAIVGRYGNRIGGARFTLDGTEYHVTPNERGNILHGGKKGFDKVIWTGEKIDAQTVEFTYLGKDGEEGFPGNLTSHVRYSLSDSNVLKIEYTATTDKNTVLNLTNHSYFNLAGAGNGDVLKHRLQIDADQYTPTNPRLIPTGELATVAGTPLDFREWHQIGQHIGDGTDPKTVAGYDNNFVLTKQDGLRRAATVLEPTTGRELQVWTDQPGIQLYTGNGLNGSIIGKGGKRYPKYGAFCLETQHFPDSPNHPNFPTTELKPGETFHTVTEYRFAVRAAEGPGADAATPPATSSGIDISTGWAAIKEGGAEGSIEADAHHAGSVGGHVLRIETTKTAGPGLGRAGAVRSDPIVVKEGEWFDIRFSAVTERGSVGLVFSLESSDGKVLARTTLPEIGRGRGRRATTAAAPAWQKYLVALHARSGDAQARLIITPIEPTNVWLDELTLSPREKQ